MAHYWQDSHVPVLQNPVMPSGTPQSTRHSTVYWRVCLFSENFPLNISKSLQEDGKIFSQKYKGFYTEGKGKEGK